MSAAPQMIPPLDRLRRIRPGRHQVVSCYLRLTPEDRQERRYLLDLRARIGEAKAALPALALDRPRRQAVLHDLDRVAGILSGRGGLPHADGVAVFASEGLGLLETIPLPHVHRSRVDVGPVPRLLDLLEVEEWFGRYLGIALDRAHARFFLVGAFDVVELPCIRQSAMRGGKYHSDRQGAPGWGEHAYHNRIREEHHRHYAGIERELRAVDAAWHLRGFALAGAAADVKAAARFLPPALQSRLLGTVRLNVREATAARVRQAVEGLIRDRDREAQRRLVADFAAAVGAGWAVDGPRATLRALGRGQARTLLVRADVRGAGFRCADSGTLALSRAECRGHGDPVPVADLASEAVDDALRQRVTVTILDDPAAVDGVDGMGALLRFR